MTAPDAVPAVEPLGADELAELEALAAATPGPPWRVARTATGGWSARTANGWEVVSVTYSDDRGRVDLIVAAVNALPRLAAALRSAWAERDQARAEHRAYIDRIQQRILTWNDDPETRLEAFAITWETVDALRAQIAGHEAELRRLERYQVGLPSSASADLTALEARIRSFVGGALQRAGVDWRAPSADIADEIMRWVADVVEDETSAAVAGAEQATTDARQTIANLEHAVITAAVRVVEAFDEDSPDGERVEADTALIRAVKALAADVPAAPTLPPGTHEAPAITALLNYVGVEGTAYVPDVPAAADALTCVCGHRYADHSPVGYPGQPEFAIRCNLCFSCDRYQVAGIIVPAAADDHEHPGGYLSTACLHDLHEPECGAAQRARGDHSHPHCKFCDAKCVCGCHTGGQVERAPRVHVDGCTLAADDPHHAGWCALPAPAVSAGEKGGPA